VFTGVSIPDASAWSALAAYLELADLATIAPYNLAMKATAPFTPPSC